MQSNRISSLPKPSFSGSLGRFSCARTHWPLVVLMALIINGSVDRHCWAVGGWQADPPHDSISATGLSWGQFRGPSCGLIENRDVLTRFSGEQLRWKAPLSGRGASTPIVVGDRVLVTSYSGFGISSEAPGKLDDLRHHVQCFDATHGVLLWRRDISGNPANSPRLSQNLMGHGFASSTPVSDGLRLFVHFGVSGVFAFDMDGKFLWQQDIGWQSDNFGSSASLAMAGGCLIVNASIESGAVYGLDPNTGRGVWKIDDVQRSWSTPVVGVTEAGREELVVVQKDWIRGFDPATGVELWKCEGIHDYIVPTPAVADGVVYCSGGKENRTVAVRLGGHGDVTATHRLWEARFGANVGSPVVFQGHVYTIHDQGIVQCLDAATGKVVKRQRIRGSGVVYASPLIVTEDSNPQPHLLVPLLSAGVAVLEANPELKFIGYNEFETDPSDFKAGLAAGDRTWFTRNDDFLYCLGSTSPIKSTGLVSSTFDPASMALIESRSKYDFDRESGKIRIYNRCLSTEPEDLVQFMLIPYASVLTEQQKTDFREYILTQRGPFESLRVRRQQLLWQHMQHPSLLPADELNQELAVIEKETMAAQRDVRTVIKKQFTPEQMAAHLAEIQGAIKK